MSILSTNKKIIKVQGTEYSAGEGIIIEDNVISVDMSAVGPNYSAGPNIDIYKEDEQSYISGRDWTDLIKEASANAYDSATGAIPEPQDLTYMSGAINYVSGEVSNASSYSYSQATGYYNTWITGQYEGDITNITNNISSLSSSLSDDYYKKTETSSKGEIDDALQYISANAGKTYEGISPIVVNNTEDKISAVTWVLSGGNNVTLVDDNINKVTRIDVEVPTPFDPTYMSGAIDNKLDTSSFGNVSGTFLTAHQTIPSAKWETASDVVQSNSAQWSENTGDEEVNNAVYNNSAKWNEISVFESNSSTYLTAHQSLDGYATQDWVTGQGYITGVDLSDYAKTSAVHNDIDSAVSGKLDTTAFSDVSGNFLTAHQDISYKLDATAFSDVSGTFLTAINIPESANWNETTSVVESNSAAWGNEFDPSYMSGVIDNKLNTTAFSDVSGTFLTAHQSLDGYATTAWVDEQGYLTAHQDISNKLDVSSFADVSGSFLTAINIPESASWNEATTAYQNASGSYLTAISIPESSTWNDVASTYQTNSSTYLTAHQSLDGYATTSELNSTSSYLSGAIDYVSANAGGSPSGFVSGSNVLFVPYGEWNPSEGNVYSANISGDITVSTGFYTNSGEYISIGHTYSLSAIGSQIGNKLNKNVIEDSNTLSLINDKAEVYSFAYKPSEIITTGISMDNYSNQGEVRIHTRVDSPYSFYSATLVIASNGFDYESIPNGWNFVNSANGSATFSKYYKAETYYDDIYFRNFWSYNLTNASAYAVACGPELVTDELAFKSDLTGGLSGDYVSGVNWVSAQQGAGPFTSIQCYEATVSGDVKVTTSAVNGLNAITYSLADIGLNLRGNSAGWNQVYNKLDTTAFDTISADWNEAITTYQTNSASYLTAHQDLSNYVPVSSYNELKASYDALSSLFATYSGQWLLPNEGV